MLRLRRQALAMVALATLWPAVVLGQPEKAGIVTTLEGHVTATRAVLSQPVPLKFKDAVFLQDTIRTGDRALARLLLGGKALVTVREHSVLTITEVPGRSVIKLESGKVGLAVAREKMRPGEDVDIRTPNAIVGVRGTVVVVDVFRATAQAGGAPAPVTTNAYLLRGTAEVTALDPATGAPIGVPVTLHPLQQFSVTGTVGRVKPIPPGQVGPLNAGLESKAHPHTEAGNKDEVKSQVQNATKEVLLALTGGPGGQAGTAAAQAARARAIEAEELAEEDYLRRCRDERCRPPILPPTTHSVPELLFLNEPFVPLGDANAIIVSGGTFSRWETLAPFWVVNSVLHYFGLTNPLIHVDGANTIVDLAGALAKIVNSTLITGQTFFVLSNGARLSSSVGLTPKEPFIEIDTSILSSSAALATVAGGQLVLGGDAQPVISIDRGAHLLATSPGRAILEVFGQPTATAVEIELGVALTLATDQSIQTARTLVEMRRTTVSAQRGAVFDHTLFNATAPVLDVMRSSDITMAFNAIDLTNQTKLTSLGPVLALSASTLTVLSGSVVNLAGGSLLRVTGDLFSLADGSTLRTLNGPLVTLSGGSVLNVSGALALFSGPGGNAIIVAGGACGGPCSTVSGIPVLATGGASVAQITIGPNPLKNPGLGTLTSTGGNSPAIVVNGPTTRVNISAP